MCMHPTLLGIMIILTMRIIAMAVLLSAFVHVVEWLLQCRLLLVLNIQISQLQSSIQPFGWTTILSPTLLQSGSRQPLVDHRSADRHVLTDPIPVLH